jgi:hypothetical protein
LKGIELIPTLLQGRRNWENKAKMQFYWPHPKISLSQKEKVKEKEKELGD